MSAGSFGTGAKDNPWRSALDPTRGTSSSDVKIRVLRFVLCFAGGVMNTSLPFCRSATSAESRMFRSLRMADSPRKAANDSISGLQFERSFRTYHNNLEFAMHQLH